MLIINADDLGRTTASTNNCLACYERGRITSASAMVYMKDSRRAAESAVAAGLPTGLHLNLDLPFDGAGSRLVERHSRIRKYLTRSKWAEIVYNPFIKKDFEYVFMSQFEEYVRLFRAEPQQVDGHHHRHLCANALLDAIFPAGIRIRRHFTFERGEKSGINRLYRKLTDKWLTRRYICTDAFFSIEPWQDEHRLIRILARADSSHVELMVHPERAEQFSYLMGRRFGELIASVPKGTYGRLPLT
jgi:chitin disaccharide deacetylase